MKIIDCFMYSDEDMMLDIRLNTLDNYISKFIICEAKFNHNGSSKNLNFKIDNFKKFKDKIIYLPIDDEPSNLRNIKKDDDNDLINSKTLDNALIRENFQRNFLEKGLKNFSEEDLVIINDLDEIPNLENFRYKNKITLFKQKMFYYKLNLIYPNFSWIGSKACKKKHLVSPQWLRNVKSKKYSKFRFDTFFSQKKYIDINFVENGGWHFSNIKTAEALDKKMRTFLHHLEYEKSGMGSKDIEENIREKNVFYNHFADKKSDKLGYKKKLEKIGLDHLPKFINLNKDKLAQWID